MVAAVRRGSSPRKVAERFEVNLRTVQVWVDRSGDQRLDRIDWSDRPRGGRREAYAGRGPSARNSSDGGRSPCRRSDRYVEAARQRSAPRRDAAPPRRSFPAQWVLDLQRLLRGTVIFLRRTNDRGEAALLGQTFAVDPAWPSRLVRCEVDLTRGQIRFHRLRRREPGQQPLAKTVPYQTPMKRFQE